MRISEGRPPALAVTEPVDAVPASRERLAASFEALLPPAATRALQRDLQRLGEPEETAPALFSGSRPTEILEDILERILPSLALDTDTKGLAMTLIREEIDIRQSLDRQRVDLEEG